MHVRLRTPVLLLCLFVLSGCSDDPLPTQNGQDHDDTEAAEELDVDLGVSPDHVHIYSEVSFSATVTDHHGDAVTDFDALRVERKAADGDTWRSTDLELDGESWVGTHTFANSGDYDIRVAGKRPDDAEAVVMHERSEPVHAAPAHTDASGYSVEFEAIPGHIHAGDTSTLRFWITDDDSPVADRTPEIHVTEADGEETTLTASETDAGVYEADHTFGSAGDATVGLHFTGSGGSAAEAEFTIPIAAPHG